ncbi:MAG: hypothetical protein MI784_10635 [Cytophagales bacterium]|nr:hypothetical protein [Cytophagales bacterium]
MKYSLGKLTKCISENNSLSGVKFFYLLKIREHRLDPMMDIQLVFTCLPANTASFSQLVLWRPGNYGWLILLWFISLEHAFSDFKRKKIQTHALKRCLPANRAISKLLFLKL